MEKTYIVKAFVHDNELEAILNEGHRSGYTVEQMFRNSAGADNQETTTVVFKSNPVVATTEKNHISWIERGWNSIVEFTELPQDYELCANIDKITGDKYCRLSYRN